jgi:hypothetical protein
MSQTWPAAELDPVRRLRVLAAATGAGLLVEAVLPLPLDRVWAVAADLERELPRLLPDVRDLRVTAAQGDRLEALARGPLGTRARFDVVLRPGWWLMQSRFLLGGMAATPVPEGTRVAFLGDLRLPGFWLLRPALAPLTRRYGRRVLERLEGRARRA